MARIPLVDETTHPDLAEVIARVKRGRRGNLLNVYRLLLHSPEIAEAWMGLIDAMRTKIEIDGRIREFAIIRAAYVNGSAYERNQHVPRLALAEGLTLEECAAIADWEQSTLFTERERAVLAYTDAVTRDIQVPDAVFAAIRPHFTDRQILELSVLIGVYNMHARVIEPLRIDPEADHK